MTPSPRSPGSAQNTAVVASSAPAPTRAPDRAARERYFKLRRRVRLRRALAVLTLATPFLTVVGTDFALRGARILEFPAKYWASYAVAAVESAVLWGLLLYAASRKRSPLAIVAGVLFVAFGAIVIGGQIYFHRQYKTYLNLDATLWGATVSESLFSQARADGLNILLSMGIPAVLCGALWWGARQLVRPRRSVKGAIARSLAPVAVFSVFLIPCSYRSLQASTPDVIYFHAVGGLSKVLLGIEGNRQVRPTVRTPPKLPAATPKPSVQRNVLFILTESVRADVGCSAPAAECPTMPRTNRALPERLPLLQMRSNSSTTAIQLAVLWSGLEPNAGRGPLHAAPVVFDFAHAAGLDTAYLSAHHQMFANTRLWVQDLPNSHQCGATDLDPLADIDLGARDELLTERAKRDLPELEEPFFALVHFSNTHVPYLVDEADAPFQPWSKSKAESDNEGYRNFYKNAVYKQDKAIAELIGFVRSSSFGPRTVIVFTSDHGEAFREHAQLGHTGAILDEEIHVPFWVDAPTGTLTEPERAGVRAAREAPTFHTDVAPTVLDLLGLLDEPAFQPWLAGLKGSSLLRPLPPPKLLALTNCSGVWSCAFKNWGVMQGFRKLEAREWDKEFHCYDVQKDPEEKHDLGVDACPDLHAAAKELYGGPPVSGQD